MNSQKGFTLIELVAILVIVAILAVYAIGNIGFSSTFIDKGVYDKLRAGIEYAGKAAVAQRHYVCVCVGASCSPANSAVFTVDTQSPDTGSNFCTVAANQVPLVLPVPDKDCGGVSNAVCSRSTGIIGATSATNFFFNPQGQVLTSYGFPSFTNVGITVSGQNNLVGAASNCGGTVSVCVNGTTGYVQ